MAHGRGERGAEVALVATRAAASLDDQRGLLYTDLVLAALGPAARKALEKLMSTGNYEYQSDFARKYFGQGKAEGKAEGEAKGKADGEAKGKAEGEAKGKAEAIIAFLRARGLEVEAETEATIRACTDHDQLDRWLRLAATASSADDLLA
jgi:flagellar biosynthesis/type III secretory pathway protein FliH